MYNFSSLVSTVICLCSCCIGIGLTLLGCTTAAMTVVLYSGCIYVLMITHDSIEYVTYGEDGNFIFRKGYEDSTLDYWKRWVHDRIIDVKILIGV